MQNGFFESTAWTMQIRLPQIVILFEKRFNKSFLVKNEFTIPQEPPLLKIQLQFCPNSSIIARIWKNINQFGMYDSCGLSWGKIFLVLNYSREKSPLTRNFKWKRHKKFIRKKQITSNHMFDWKIYNTKGTSHVTFLLWIISHKNLPEFGKTDTIVDKTFTKILKFWL